MHVRSLLAVIVAALLVGPAAAHAQAKKSAKASPAPAASAGTVAAKPSIDGWIGYESDELGGIQVRGDYVWPFKVLAPNFDLSIVGAAGFSYISQSESSFGVSVDSSAWMLKLIPTARFTYNFPQDRRWSVFGDAGLGLTYTSVSVDSNYGFGVQSASDSSLGVTLRLGAGGFFKLDPRWQLGATVVFDPTSGDFGFDTWSFLAGAKYTL